MGFVAGREKGRFDERCVRGWVSRTYAPQGEHGALGRAQPLVDVLLEHAFEQRVGVGREVRGTGEFLREDLPVQFLCERVGRVFSGVSGCVEWW